MKAHWIAVKTKYEAFEPRERLLLLGALMASFYMMFELLLNAPLTKESKSVQVREKTLNTSIFGAEKEIDVLKKLVAKDPNIQLKKEREELIGTLATLDKDLAQLQQGLVSAAELPVVLGKLVHDIDPIELVQIETLPISEVLLDTEEKIAIDLDAADLNDKPEQIRVYRHGVQVEVIGNYQTIYNYLVEIEQSKWQFYWESIEYEVKDHPEASAILKVYTLSPERGVFNG